MKFPVHTACSTRRSARFDSLDDAAEPAGAPLDETEARDGDSVEVSRDFSFCCWDESRMPLSSRLIVVVTVFASRARSWACHSAARSSYGKTSMEGATTWNR